MLLNKDRALAMMKEEKINALVATQPEHVTYVTDWHAWGMPGSFVYRGLTQKKGFQSYAVLTRDGARSLIIKCSAEVGNLVTYGWQVDNTYVYGASYSHRPESYEPQRQDERRWLELYDSETNHPGDAATGLIRALRKQGVNRGRIGIEFSNLAPDAEEQLRSEFNQAEFVDAGELFARIRYVKTADEIERLRRAALVNERALQEVMKAIKPGVTELEMRRVYRTALAQEDADLVFFTCAGGLRAALWAPPSNYSFKLGDHVIIDPGCRVNCYYGDTGVCGVIGEPTDKHKQMWKGVTEVWEAGVAGLRPGVRPSQLFDTMAAVQKKVFGYVAGYFGHGIGLTVREGPLINRVPGTGTGLLDMGEDPPFEAGMVIALEIPMPVLGFGGVHIEDTLLITEKGNEPLIHTMRDLYVFSS